MVHPRMPDQLGNPAQSAHARTHAHVRAYVLLGMEFMPDKCSTTELHSTPTLSSEIVFPHPWNSNCNDASPSDGNENLEAEPTEPCLCLTVWEHSESTKLDHSMGRKKGLLGVKLPRLSGGEGQREDKNGKNGGEASGIYKTVSRGLFMLTQN